MCEKKRFRLLEKPTSVICTVQQAYTVFLHSNADSRNQIFRWNPTAEQSHGDRVGDITACTKAIIAHAIPTPPWP
jgi:hypothetical protein